MRHSDNFLLSFAAVLATTTGLGGPVPLTRAQTLRLGIERNLGLLAQETADVAS